MKISAVALIASLALAASPALAAQNTSGGGGNANSPSNAQNQSRGKFSPQNLSSAQIKKVQTALDNAGFNAGKADGKWGPGTEKAEKAYLKSKNRSSVSQLDDQDLNGMGLDRSELKQGGRHYGSAKRMRNR